MLALRISILAAIVGFTTVNAFSGSTFSDYTCGSGRDDFSTQGTYHQIDAGAGSVIIDELDGFIFTDTDCSENKYHIPQGKCTPYPDHKRIGCVTEVTQ